MVELLALNKRTVFVPLSKGASRGDQIENVRVVADRSSMRVIMEEDLNVESLTRAIQAVESAPLADAYPAPDAVQAIAAELERLAVHST